ncbi:flagellar hook-basal body protein, partial [Cribrihabitans sp. XS_ASV171]
GTVLPTGVQLGLGVRPSAISVHLAQGALSETGSDLDLAIEGRGYLEVTLPSGQPGFTRDGSLKRSAEGLIVTSDGYAVAPEITIPEDARSISINAEGEVYAYFDDAAEGQLLGQFTLSNFANAKGLEALGGNLFRETEASGPPVPGNPGEDGLGTLRQGYLEDSSVDAVREVTELIEAQRGYEMNAKVISAVDQMMGATTQVR